MEDKNIMNETSCTVIMDGVATTSSDYVAILSKENGDASFYFNTDTATLGMAVKLLTKAFVDCTKECSEEERELLRGLFSSSEEVAPDETN